MRSLKKIWVNYGYDIGNELLLNDNDYWIVRARLASRIYDGGMEYKVLVEYVESRLDRLERDIDRLHGHDNTLKRKIKELEVSDKRLEDIIRGNLLFRTSTTPDWSDLHSNPDYRSALRSVRNYGNLCDDLKESGDIPNHKCSCGNDKCVCSDNKANHNTTSETGIIGDKKINNRLVVSRKLDTKDNNKNYIYEASCPNCGTLLYSADAPNMLITIFTTKRHFCFGCGIRVNADQIELDESKYCNTGC